MLDPLRFIVWSLSEQSNNHSNVSCSLLKKKTDDPMIIVFHWQCGGGTAVTLYVFSEAFGK